MLKVKLKNAVMQSWQEVKQGRNPSNIQTMVDDMLAKKRESSKEGGGDYSQQKKSEAEEKAKLARKKMRKEEHDRRMTDESKDSYLSIEQFEFLKKRIELG